METQAKKQGYYSHFIELREENNLLQYDTPLILNVIIVYNVIKYIIIVMVKIA